MLVKKLLSILMIGFSALLIAQSNCSNPDSNRATILIDSMVMDTIFACDDTISLQTFNVGEIKWRSNLNGVFIDSISDSTVFEFGSDQIAQREATVILEIENECGLFKDTLVLFYQRVLFDPSPDTVLYIPGEVELDFNINVRDRFFSVGWNTEAFLEEINGYRATATEVSDDVTYILTATTDSAYGNCKSTDTISIEFRDSIWGPFLPDAFTPNGDGEHDIFYVRIGGESSVWLQIYDRWEKLIFESRNKLTGWDGTFNGMEVGSGVYTYIVRGGFTDGSAYFSKGKVTVLR